MQSIVGLLMMIVGAVLVAVAVANPGAVAIVLVAMIGGALFGSGLVNFFVGIFRI